MKNRRTCYRVIIGIIFFLSLSFNNLQAQCNNADFGDSTFTGWTGTWGHGICRDSAIVDSSMVMCFCPLPAPLQNTGFNKGPLNVGPMDNYLHHIMNAGIDANLSAVGVSLPVVWPGGSYAACLGNISPAVPSSLPSSGTLSYTFTVTPENSMFAYHYAVVVSDGGHPFAEQACFAAGIKTATGDSIPCAGVFINPNLARTIAGFDSVTDAYGEKTFYTNWVTKVTSLSSYLGQTLTLTFTANSCLPDTCAGSHYVYAYLSAECMKCAIAIDTTRTCSPQGLPLSAPRGFGSYSWTGPGIVSRADSQAVYVNQSGRYTVVMTASDSLSCTYTLDTMVTAVSDSIPLIPDFSYVITCVDSASNFTDFSTPQGHITSWYWNFGDSSTSAFRNPAHIFNRAGTYPVTLIISDPPCANKITKNVIVLPNPTSPFIIVDPFCTNDSSLVYYLGNAPDTAHYIWNFDGGRATLITRHTPGYVSWTTSGTKNITLIVKEGSCVSAQSSLNVVVSPPPILSITPGDTFCSGHNIVLTASGASVYSWTGPGIYGWSADSPTVVSIVNSSQTFIVIGFDNNHCSTTETINVTVHTCLGVLEFNEGKISVYPNPAKNDFTIEFSGYIQTGQMAIYDVLGQPLYVEEINNAPSGFSKHIHLNDTSGVYLLTLIANEKVYSKKLVIE